MDYDIVIIGAGVAGASAAYHAARAGARVAVIEKSALPRYKTCGGGVLPRAAALLPFDIGDCAEHLCHNVALHFHSSGLQLRIRRETPLIHMTMRARLDYRLLMEALQGGAELYAPSAVRSIEQDRHRVRIRSGRTSLTAAFVIACDGVASVTARAAGWSDRPALVPACEWEVRVPDTVLARFQDSARLDFDLVTNGYAWVFPKGEHLSIGAGAFASEKFRGHHTLQNYLRHLEITPVTGMERHGYALPRHPRREGFVRGRILLAGDAAGLVDPLTGEGITFALLSGRLAANTLLESGLDPDRAGAAYQRLLAQEILSEIRMAHCLSRLFYGYPRLVRWLLRRYGPVLAAAMIKLFSGERTYHQLLATPRNYLRLFSGGAISRYDVEVLESG